MKLTIESTTKIAYTGLTPSRVWRGTTPQGHPIDVLVYRLGVPPEAQPEFDAAVAAGEILLQAPTAEEALRDSLIARQAHHELGCPGGGEPCWKDRAAIIAYLCHALGLGKHPGGTDAVLAELARYDRECTSATCGHTTGDAK